MAIKRTPAEGKEVPGQLFVHIDRPGGVRLVGELVIDDQAPGGFAAKFRYVDEWIANGFPLDPLNLPLQRGWVSTDNKFIKLGVLFDAGPDMWGRRVLQNAELGGDVDEQRILIMGRGNGVGALLFSESNQLQREHLPSFDTLPTIEDDLLRVHEAAHNVYNRTPLPSHLQGILAGSWSIGGARAKAVMRNALGEIWIAKLSEPGDVFDRQRCELANLRMARAIGMDVPQCHVVDTELGSVFLIKRFDRTSELQRLHFASAISLVSAVPTDKRLTAPIDRAIFSYARIADIISRVSPNPGWERRELFARMVLNVCLRNTDDHLKNLAFVEAPGTDPRRGLLRLAPVFDVVTQPHPQHYLRIGHHGREGTLENILSDVRWFGLTQGGAKEIVQRVTTVVRDRVDFYAEAGLGEADISYLMTLTTDLDAAVPVPELDPEPVHDSSPQG